MARGIIAQANTGGNGVNSLNGLTGVLSLTSIGSTISITPSGTTINLETINNITPAQVFASVMLRI